jgi:beta-glucosidase
VERPENELKAFARVQLQPGESQVVHFALKREAISFFDPARHAWTANPGVFEVRVGSSSRDLRQTARFHFR